MLQSDSIVNRLLLAAEREIAIYGIEGLNLLKVAETAGSKNRSAVAYHFGSKEGLIEFAIRRLFPELLEHHSTINRLIDENEQAEGENLDLLLLTFIYPLFETLRTASLSSTSYYYRMINRVDVINPAFEKLFEHNGFKHDFNASISALTTHLEGESESKTYQVKSSAQNRLTYLMLILRAIMYGLELEVEEHRQSLDPVAFDKSLAQSAIDTVAFLHGGLTRGSSHIDRSLMAELITASQQCLVEASARSAQSADSNIIDHSRSRTGSVE